MSSDFVLLSGALVRGSSWEPTAEHLRNAGCHVQIPDILAHHDSPPAWSAWTQHLIAHVAPRRGLIVVGHSSASILAADLAMKLPANAVIIVDGEAPPSHGAASPVRPALREHVRGLVQANGTLPIWSKWFSGDARRLSLIGLDMMVSDPAAFLLSKANFQKCGLIGSTIQSNSQDGIIYRPASFRHRRFTIMQQKKRSGVVGR